VHCDREPLLATINRKSIGLRIAELSQLILVQNVRALVLDVVDTCNFAPPGIPGKASSANIESSCLRALAIAFASR